MLNIDGISNRIQNNGFVIEIDSNIVQLAQGARVEYLKAISSVRVHASQERFSPKDLERGRFRKFTIGTNRCLRQPVSGS